MSNDNSEELASLHNRLRNIADRLRSLSDSPLPGPMYAEEYLPLLSARISKLINERNEAIRKADFLTHWHISDSGIKWLMAKAEAVMSRAEDEEPNKKLQSDMYDQLHDNILNLQQMIEQRDEARKDLEHATERIRELEAAVQGRTVSCICGGKGK